MSFTLVRQCNALSEGTRLGFPCGQPELRFNEISSTLSFVGAFNAWTLYEGHFP